jgi:cytochrome P450
MHIHSFAEDNLKYVVLDLLSAGTETTATTIQWAVLFLVNHPEVQENIRASGSLRVLPLFSPL